MKINKIKKRSYKLFNKLFIYLPVDILIYLRNFLLGVFNSGHYEFGESNEANEASVPVKKQEKRLIIFRHDGIGDYVMFRNFLEVLRKSPKFAGYKITLLGNAAWKDLAEFLDKDYIDEFIWLDKKKFTANFFYRYKKFKEITSVKYDILIHPFSREFFNADNDLAFLIKADKKIGSIRIPRFTKLYKTKILEKIYNELIPDEENVRFEFYKNKIFFEKMLPETAPRTINASINSGINLNRPFINLPPYSLPPYSACPLGAANSSASALSDVADLKSKLGISSPYAAFFIGASVKHRKWPPSYFAETANYLHTKYSFHIVLCGGKSELNDAAEFKKHFQADLADKSFFTDAVGKISLIDLLYIIKDASLVISNETMAPHIAMALADADADNDDTSNSTQVHASKYPSVKPAAEPPAKPSVKPHAKSSVKPAVIVISTGEDSYEHFSPYPEEIDGNSNYSAVFHPYIEKNFEEYIGITETFGRGYDDRFDISEITVKSVLDKIDEKLSSVST